jgi:hypothetical protein
MKKSKILTIAGLFIIVTVILSMVGKSNVYEKKVNYTSTDEVIMALNSKPLAAFKNESKKSYDIVYSDVFNECLSKRKRVTCPSINCSKLNIKVNEDKNDTENKERIKNNYISLGKNIKSFNISDKIEAYNLVGTCEDIYKKKLEKIDMDVVMIDEGEGWVIDYFMINSQGDKNDSNKQ